MAVSTIYALVSVCCSREGVDLTEFIQCHPPIHYRLYRRLVPPSSLLSCSLFVSEEGAEFVDTCLSATVKLLQS